MTATSSERRSASKGLPKQLIERAALDLQKLPPKRQPLREIIALLYDPITQAIGKGYSYEEVSVLLAREGISIAPSSLKAYLMRARQSKNPKVLKLEARQRSEREVEVAPTFSSALDYVLTKNAELYQRLA
jgi:hypothetical protein